jgi:hypothetical protein
MTKPVAFSDELEAWLHSRKPKTIAGLISVSGEKSFALVFLILMAIPALPIPTGGITHVFEVIVMLLCLELIIGRRTIWLPKRWLHRKLGKSITGRGIPYLIKKIRWLEKHSRPRMSGLLAQRQYLRLVGLTVLVLTIGAFVSPPFSGLDTLPSMGVVGIALGLILEDVIVYIVGLAIGIGGIILEIGLGAAATEAVRRFF